MVNIQSFKDDLFKKITDLEDAIIHTLPSKGEKEEYCQQLTLINRLAELEYAVNGISKKDFDID